MEIGVVTEPVSPHRPTSLSVDPPPSTGSGPQQRLIDLAGRLSQTIALARALLQGGRQVDLTGIDDGIGVLCAQTLDLAFDDARAMLPKLREVLAQMDLLASSLRTSPASGTPRC